MDNWELSIINRIEIGLVLGWSFYEPDETEDELNHYEFNLYLLFVQFQLKW